MHRDFANWIRQTRLSKRLTLAEVGQRAGHRGAYISIHEHASGRRPRLETVDKLAKALADNPEEERRFVTEARRVAGYAAPQTDFEVPNEPANDPASRLQSIVTRSEEPLIHRITINPTIFGGKPIIRGHRLAVEHVLGMLAAGDSADTILEGYSWLEADDIRACLAYARRIIANERIEPFDPEPAR